MAKFVKDDHFLNFSHALQDLIQGYGDHSDENWTDRQRKQVNTLVKLEKRFRKILQADSRGWQVYKQFIKFIMDDKKNILAARPYFRERQDIFAEFISPAIKSRKFNRLYRFDVNYTFILFALNAVNWGINSKVRKAALEVYNIRKEIVELNMPLAISRARIFRERTPESHLSYMDMVQISLEGLINAVDKFVPPYSPVFRSVIIGRSVGDLIASFSDTMLHFYPSDRRKIYRANKAQRKLPQQAEVNFEELSNHVNSGTKLDNPTNPSEIQQLTTAASHVSLDSPAPVNTVNIGEEGDTLMDRYAADDSIRPDVRVENFQLQGMLYNSIQALEVMEIKFLRMKGIAC